VQVIDNESVDIMLISRVSLLSIFYAILENNELSHIIDKDDMLARMVDDFLFITPDKRRAEAFLMAMNEGNDTTGLLIALLTIYCYIRLSRVRLFGEHKKISRQF
jgi:hypothetical protein